MRIILARHGETLWNQEKRIQGVHDIPLNEEGKKQALEAANDIAASDVHLIRIYSSPLSRAFETAMTIARVTNTECESLSGLEEMNLGIFEGMSWDDARMNYPEEYCKWDADRNHHIVPGGESYNAVADRAITAICNAINEARDSKLDGDILFVTHSATMKSVLCVVKHIQFRDMNKTMKFGNLHRVIVEGDELERLIKYGIKIKERQNTNN